MKQHMIGHREKLKYKCTDETCPNAYTRTDKLLDHVRSSHPELLTLICKYSACKKGFLTAKVLKKHEAEHSKEKAGKRSTKLGGKHC